MASARSKPLSRSSRTWGKTRRRSLMMTSPSKVSISPWRMRRCNSARVTPARRAARDRVRDWGMQGPPDSGCRRGPGAEPPGGAGSRPAGAMKRYHRHRRVTIRVGDCRRKESPPPILALPPGLWGYPWRGHPADTADTGACGDAGTPTTGGHQGGRPALSATSGPSARFRGGDGGLLRRGRQRPAPGGGSGRPWGPGPRPYRGHPLHGPPGDRRRPGTGR